MRRLPRADKTQRFRAIVIAIANRATPVAPSFSHPDLQRVDFVGCWQKRPRRLKIGILVEFKIFEIIKMTFKVMEMIF